MCYNHWRSGNSQRPIANFLGDLFAEQEKKKKHWLQLMLYYFVVNAP